MRATNRSLRLDSATLAQFTERALANLGNLHRRDVRTDAGETAAFARELEHIFAQTYEQKYPDAKWRSLVPINREVPAGAETFSENTFDQLGEALFGDPDADNFPLVEVKGTNVAGKVKSILSGYQYTIQDIRASALMGRPLDALRARAARAVVERAVDKLVFRGDTTYGFTGLAGAGTAVTITDKGADDTWTSTTVTGGATALGQAIADDVHKMASTIVTNTKGVYGSRVTLVVGTGGWGVLNAPRTFGSVPMTLAKFLLSQHPWLEAIEYSPRLDTAGASNKERVLLYVRDPECLEVVIPQDFEQFPPQQRNLKFVVPCHMRYGGLIVRQPTIVYMDGTQP